MTTLSGADVTAGIAQAIREIARAVLESDLDPSVDMFDQGATSLAFLRIVAQVNERYGITVDVGELEDASLDMLSGLVARQLKSQLSATAEGQR
jgi:acyl carrier protein